MYGGFFAFGELKAHIFHAYKTKTEKLAHFF